MKSRIQKTASQKERDGEQSPKNPEPEPLLEMPCPAWMPAHGKRLWNDLAPKLIEQRILTEWDQAGFELLCMAYHNARTAQTELAKVGMFATAGHGGPKTHPALGAFGIASSSFNKFADVFGLTPMARKRIDLNIVASREEKNKFAKI